MTLVSLLNIIRSRRLLNIPYVQSSSQDTTRLSRFLWPVRERNKSDFFLKACHSNGFSVQLTAFLGIYLSDLLPLNFLVIRLEMRVLGKCMKLG